MVSPLYAHMVYGDLTVVLQVSPDIFLPVWWDIFPRDAPQGTSQACRAELHILVSVYHMVPQQLVVSAEVYMA